MATSTNFRGEVGVGESDDRNVHIAGLSDRLMILVRIDDDEKTRLLEGLLDLIGEST